MLITTGPSGFGEFSQQCYRQHLCTNNNCQSCSEIYLAQKTVHLPLTVGFCELTAVFKQSQYSFHKMSTNVFV